MNQRLPTGLRYHVRWLVSPLYQVEDAASLIAGLGVLEQKGIVKVRVGRLSRPPGAPHVFEWEVTDLRTGRGRRVVLDEFDRNDRFDLEACSRADVYFKRHYNAAAIARLPDQARAKIRRSGLVFGCHASGSFSLMMRAALQAFVARAFQGGPGAVGPAIRQWAGNLSWMQGFLDVSAYERRPGDPLYDRVVYQTRIWPTPDDPTVDRSEVNAQRIHLVLALRKAFGGPSRIGLLPTRFARRVAPEAVLKEKIRRIEYAWQLRTSRVAVNSHGLDGSAGFKLGESLAAGCAVVSQHFRFELPEPLIPDVNYLPYETEEECVAQCRRLLADDELAGRIRAANRMYYARFVRPEVLAWRTLARVFEEDEEPGPQDA